MKHLIITTLVILLTLVMRANDKLVFVKVEDTANLYSLFENQNLKIHYYTDNYIIGSINEKMTIKNDFFVLDDKAFFDVSSYFIVYCPMSQRQRYLTEVQNSGKVLYSTDNFLIMKPINENISLIPAKNDGMVRISNKIASLPKRTVDFPVITEVDPIIQFLTEKVNTDSIMATIQHLQDYGTRAYNEPESYAACDWLIAKYEAMGLETEIHAVSISPGSSWGWGYYPQTNTSGNVIAYQTGTTYPDEFIVCGSHYDSWRWDPWPPGANNAPGADDNASGTAGIVEIARILSNYEFERSIIYCNFTAEEFGLFGSEAYANRCSQQGMNILGYFNIDMSGYLAPGSDIHIHLIYPNSAAPLANYFTNIAEVYFPEIPVEHFAALPGGDSDHTSFNNAGYYGIFPFEDKDYDSPYIHSANDIIGVSVNTPEQCRIFTQITFASISTLAGLVDEITKPVPNFNASSTTITEGNSVQFTDLSTNEPTEWHWYFDGGTPEESAEQNPEVLYENIGNFSVKLVVSNSAGSNELNRDNYITVTSLADFYADKTEIEEGETIVFTNTSQNNIDSYQWTFEGGTPEESTDENPSIQYDTAGKYSVTLTVTNGDTERTEQKLEYITVTPKTGIQNIDTNANIVVYPNPTRGELTIDNGKLTMENVELIDITGRKQKIIFNSQFNSIDVSHLPAGIYFLKINGQTMKIVKK